MDREFMAITENLLNDIWANQNKIQNSQSWIECKKREIAELEADIESDQRSIDILNQIATSAWAINSLLNYAVLFDNLVYFYMGDRLIRVSKSVWYNEVSTRDSYALIEVGENKQ